MSSRPSRPIPKPGLGWRGVVDTSLCGPKGNLGQIDGTRSRQEVPRWILWGSYKVCRHQEKWGYTACPGVPREATWAAGRGRWPDERARGSSSPYGESSMLS